MSYHGSCLIMDKLSIIIHFSSLVIYQQVELHLLLLHQFFQPVALEHLGTGIRSSGSWKKTGHGDGFSVYLRTLRPGDMENIWKHGWNTYVSHFFTCFSMNMFVSYSLTIFRNSLDTIKKINILEYRWFNCKVTISDPFRPLSLSGLHGFWGLLLNSFAVQKLETMCFLDLIGGPFQVQGFLSWT